MSRKLGKVLLVRLDRIGDLVLTLPVEEGLRKIDGNAEFLWWIPKGLGFVTRHALPPRNAREIDVRIGLKAFFSLWAEIRRAKPRMAIVFHAPWWVSLLLFLARIPLRAGPRSQWHQYLFFNRRIRQKRSRAEHSELEYNFRLAEGALNLGDGWLPRSHLRLQGPAGDSVERHGLEPRRYVVVHPGMGGSAQNWPTPLYAQLINRLAERVRVVVTGTRADAPFVTPIRQMLEGHANITWLTEGKLQGPELLTVLQNAGAVVAPSTGVVHLAASTGAPTLGLYSPVRVQCARRWGPIGDHVEWLSPAVRCPATFKCQGQACEHFDCMRTIEVARVEQSIDKLLGGTGSGG